MSKVVELKFEARPGVRIEIVDFGEGGGISLYVVDERGRDYVAEFHEKAAAERFASFLSAAYDRETGHV